MHAYDSEIHFKSIFRDSEYLPSSREGKFLLPLCIRHQGVQEKVSGIPHLSCVLYVLTVSTIASHAVLVGTGTVSLWPLLGEE